MPDGFTTVARYHARDPDRTGACGRCTEIHCERASGLGFGLKQFLRSANNQRSEHTGTLAKVSLDMESMRETVTTGLLDTQSALMTLQESVRDYYPRMEMLQATLTTLQTEHRRLSKVLRAWSSRLKDMEQIVAAVPSIRTEQAGIRNELAEWNSRFADASEVLAEFLQSEVPPDERPVSSEAPPTS